MTDTPYQLLPPLGDDEYAALRADIEANGIRVPVDIDENGQTLDGHHRQRIAADLGIPCPTRVVAGLTEDDKRAHAVAVNVHRRALTMTHRRELVRAELERDPSRSDRAIGRLCGVDHKTVGVVRRGGRGIPQVEEFTPEQIAEARRSTDELQRGLSEIYRTSIELARGGYALAAVRMLTEGMDTTLAMIPNDAEFHAGVRLIFEPMIRDVLALAAH